MTKPTKGPYLLVKRGNSPNGAAIVAPDGSRIANISGKADRPIWEKNANGRLLAKSWEMREQFEAFAREHCEQYCVYEGNGTMEHTEECSEARALLTSIDGDSQ